MQDYMVCGRLSGILDHSTTDCYPNIKLSIPPDIGFPIRKKDSSPSGKGQRMVPLLCSDLIDTKRNSRELRNGIDSAVARKT
jgi:hypothetical protein